MSSSTTLPDSSSPTVILTNPTPEQITQTWSYTYPEWGHGLSHQAYCDREAYMLTMPLAHKGGMKHWMLTDTSSTGSRPILSSCETLRKPALVRGRDGIVRDTWAEGVASVFTQAEFRGKGYAGKMMKLLGERLAQRQKGTGEPDFSVLFSDIGKIFYAKNGWVSMENRHADIPVRGALLDANPSHISFVSIDDLYPLAEADEKLLREELSHPNPIDPSRIRIALVPNIDALLWAIYREAFICDSTFNLKPTIHGALYTAPFSPNSRVWGLWSRNYYGGLENPDKNSLSFIRFVIEDKNISDSELAKAVKAIFGAAAREAKEWTCGKIEIWNPTERVGKILAEDKDFRATFVERDEKNLASLNWFGEGAAEDVDWVANERFEWC